MKYLNLLLLILTGGAAAPAQELPSVIPGIPNITKEEDIAIQMLLLDQEHEKARAAIKRLQYGCASCSYQTLYMFQLCNQSTPEIDKRIKRIEYGMQEGMHMLLHDYFYNIDYFNFRHYGDWSEEAGVSLKQMPDRLRRFWESKIKETDVPEIRLEE